MPDHLIPNLLNAGRVLKRVADEPGTTVLQLSRDLHVPRTTVLRTITTAERMAKETALILERGYAVDEEEYYDGIRCAAVPVFNGRGQVQIALGYHP